MVGLNPIMRTRLLCMGHGLCSQLRRVCWRLRLAAVFCPMRCRCKPCFASRALRSLSVKNATYRRPPPPLRICGFLALRTTLPRYAARLIQLPPVLIRTWITTSTSLATWTTLCRRVRAGRRLPTRSWCVARVVSVVHNAAGGRGVLIDRCHRFAPG